MALTPKQEKFCQEIVAGKNQSDAYRAAYDTAGMKPVTVNRAAKELMDNPNIAARIAELRAPAIAKVQVDAQWIMEKLVKIAERCMGDAEFNPAGANKAIELLAKHVDVRAFASDKLELTGKDGGAIEVDNLSDTERAAKIAALVNKGLSRKGE